MSTDIPDAPKSIQHFLSIRDLEPAALSGLVDFAIARKAQFKRGELKPRFTGKVLAMVFQKSSLRTRLGFEAAMTQLGGHAIDLEDHHIGIARRESIRDVARVISSMADIIMARVFGHQTVVELAAHSSVPVINGLSDWSHPCQGLADLMTVREHFGEAKGLTLAYVGDANNVARSLLYVCMKTGMTFRIASPPGYGLDQGTLHHAQSVRGATGCEVFATDKPADAVAGADVVYTDVWTSMGQEAEQEARVKAFAGFQLNAELMKLAKPTAIVMHCLPAHRGVEITDEVIDGPQSVVFPQAENRMHSQRALLEALLSRTK